MAQQATKISFPRRDAEKAVKSGQETLRVGSNALEHSNEKMARLQVAAPVFYQCAIQGQLALLIFKEQPGERVRIEIIGRTSAVSESFSGDPPGQGVPIIRIALISGLRVAMSLNDSFGRAA
jgi:hypothetical protein